MYWEKEQQIVIKRLLYKVHSMYKTLEFNISYLNYAYKEYNSL